LAFIDHSELLRLINTHRGLAHALWRETLVDAAIFREWIVNIGTRSAAGRLAHLIAELRERLNQVGLENSTTFICTGASRRNSVMMAEFPHDAAISVSYRWFQPLRG
jgi:hypothetical protein